VGASSYSYTRKVNKSYSGILSLFHFEIVNRVFYIKTKTKVNLDWGPNLISFKMKINIMHEWPKYYSKWRWFKIAKF